MNQLLSNREEIITNTELLIDMAKDISPLENKIGDLEKQLEIIWTNVK